MSLVEKLEKKVSINVNSKKNEKNSPCRGKKSSMCSYSVRKSSEWNEAVHHSSQNSWLKCQKNEKKWKSWLKFGQKMKILVKNEKNEIFG